MLPRLRPTALATIATIISILLELSRLIPIAPFYLAAFSLESGAKLITFDKAVGAKTKDSIVLALP